MAPPVLNLLTPPATRAPGEQCEILLETTALRLERIVSRGCPTPVGEWYDQERPEWVLLACGSAQLGYADGSAQNLQAGDFLLLRAGCRHRVESVSEDAVWLALHFEEAAAL